MATSSQKFVAQNRAPRVRIEYDVELYGSKRKVELPFVTGVLADLSGTPAQPLPPVDQRRFLHFDIDSFDDRLRSMQPRVAFQVPSTLTAEGQLNVDVTFQSMNDFSPASVARHVDAPNKLLDARTRLANLLTYMDGKTGAEELIACVLRDPSHLKMIAALPPESPDTSPDTHSRATASGKETPMSDTPPFHDDEHGSPEMTPEAIDFCRLLEREFRPRSEHARAALHEAVRTLAQCALVSPFFSPGEAGNSIRSIIDDIDQKLTEQLNLIMNHPDFRTLESAWRGLHHLVVNTETDETLKIHVMNISKDELGKTLKRFKGVAWDQSPLFKLIHEEEYRQFGGEPFGVLIGDYYFNHTPPDVELLGEISKIAAFAHAPFIAGADPGVMQMDSWQELRNPRDLSKIFDTPEYAGWRALRASEDARFIGLTMPRILARLPYGRHANPIAEFEFEEGGHSNDSSCFTWLNAAYAMAVNINRSFKAYGWCARIWGVETGGAVEGLPIHRFWHDDGSADTMCPTEVAIPDRREAELARAGFIPLVHHKNSNFAAFNSAQSLYRPPEFEDADVTTNAALSARLPYVFACSRFAQYLKCLARDNFGALKDCADTERALNRWIIQYVDPDPYHSAAHARAYRPLAAAEIKVRNVVGEPGYYGATFNLRPHYQLEGLTLSLRFASRIPAPDASF
jgi:type VI secretion system protein ImpC